MLNKDIFERMTSLLKKAPCTSLCKGLSSCDYFFLFRKTVTSIGYYQIGICLILCYKYHIALMVYLNNTFTMLSVCQKIAVVFGLIVAIGFIHD